MYDIEKDWTTRAGLRAVAVRHGSGHLCGYVGVGKDHKFYGRAYDAPSGIDLPDDTKIGNRGVIDLFLFAMRENPLQDVPISMLFDVHGSLTYSGGEGYPIESDGLWWFGFDCAHADDTPETCNLPYVEKECEQLAKQLIQGEQERAEK